MIKKIVVVISILFFMTSCSSESYKKLKISATTWIGYTPLFYAKEKGWLKELNIKLLNVTSLSENMYLYEAGNSDAYVGTQYEYSVLIQKHKSLMPIMLFDRSYGGDIVMSNMSLSDLQNSNKTINVYLEMDSINNTIFKDFISNYSLEEKAINYINQDQTQISLLEGKNIKNPTVIVTYIPYNTMLENDGFKEIASTKDGLQLLVVDAMFTSSKVFHEHEEQFRELKKLTDKAIDVLQRNPKEFYKVIQPYMLDMDYKTFNESLNKIIWINKTFPSELKERLQEANFPTRDLI